MTAAIKLVTIPHYTKLLQYYWLYFLCVHYIPWTYFSDSWKSVPLNPLHLHLCPRLPPFCNHPFVQWLCIYESISVLRFSCVLSFRFHIWMMSYGVCHLSFSVWLISCNLMLFRFIHVVTMAKFYSFFMELSLSQIWNYTTSL